MIERGYDKNYAINRKTISLICVLPLNILSEKFLTTRYFMINRKEMCRIISSGHFHSSLFSRTRNLSEPLFCTLTWNVENGTTYIFLAIILLYIKLKVPFLLVNIIGTDGNPLIELKICIFSIANRCSLLLQALIRLFLDRFISVFSEETRSA